MQSRRLALVTGSTLFLCSLAFARASGGKVVPEGPLVVGETAEKVDTFLTRLTGFGFSGALILEQGGKPVLVKGYGLADRQAGRPVNADTVFTIGSITKQFTGAAIVKLEQEGKLSVNDRITKYFDGVPPDKAEITLHQLLTHTAGFPGAIGDDFDASATRERFLEEAMSTRLLFQPGERHEYSNVGYSLLGMIVEKVSGKSYEQYLTDELFTPSGMTRTGYLLPKYRDEELAVGYQGDERWGSVIRKPMPEDGPSWHLRANGGIHSTVRDMYRWRLALAGEDILSKSAKEKLFAAHVPEGPGGRSHYGYGWVTFQTPRGTKLIAHNGGNGIFSADFRDYVDEDAMFFVATNVAEYNIDTLSNRIASVVFKLEYQLPPETVRVDAAALAGCAGAYKLPGGASLLATADKDGVRISPQGQEAFDALALGAALSPGIVEQAGARTKQILEETARGEYSTLVKAMSEGMPPEEVRRMAERHWSELRAEHGELRGVDVLGSASHRRRMVATTVRMNLERGTHYAQYIWVGNGLRGVRSLDGPPSYRFLPLSPTQFVTYDFASGKIGRLSFPSSKELQIERPGGTITALRAEK